MVESYVEIQLNIASSCLYLSARPFILNFGWLPYQILYKKTGWNVGVGYTQWRYGNRINRVSLGTLSRQILQASKHLVLLRTGQLLGQQHSLLKTTQDENIYYCLKQLYSPFKGKYHLFHHLQILLHAVGTTGWTRCQPVRFRRGEKANGPDRSNFLPTRIICLLTPFTYRHTGCWHDTAVSRPALFSTRPSFQ